MNCEQIPVENLPDRGPPSEKVIHQPVWLDRACSWCRSVNKIGQDTIGRSCFVCGHIFNEENNHE